MSNFKRQRASIVATTFLAATTAGTLYGAVAHYEYNAAGDMTKTWVTDGVTTAFQSLSTTDYDGLGRQVSVTQVAEMSGSAIDKARITSYIYDVAGSVVTSKLQTDAGEEWTIHEYDGAGRRITTSGPLISGQSGPSSVVGYSYDKLGNVTKQSLLIMGSSTYADSLTEYDPLNRNTRSVDPAGNQIMRIYNSRGLLRYEYKYDGAALAAQSQLVYDHMGRVLTRARLANPVATTIDLTTDEVRTYTYNTAGAVFTETTYDSGTLARPLMETREYDAYGRLTRKFDPKEYASIISYDGYGRVTAETRQDGNTRQATHEYDGSSTRVTKTIKAETVAGRQETRNESYLYDALGRRTAVSKQRNLWTSYLYDMAGRQTAIIEAVGYENRPTDYVYSQDGKLVQLVAYNTGGVPQSTDYTYTPLGVSTINYPDQKKILFYYYPNGAVSRRVDQEGQWIEYAYDLRGLLIGKVSNTGALWAYAYDGLGRMTVAQTNEDGGASPTSEIAYSYDALSRVTHESQMTTRDGPVQVVDYEYDQSGKRTKLTYPATQ